MISKYISTWWLVFFYIWFMGYLLKIKTITNNINVYYTTTLLFLGFMGINFYYTQYLGRSFKSGLWLTLLYYHLVPIIIIIGLNKRIHKGAMKTLIVSIILYIFHMIYINKSIYDVYLIEKIPESWDEVNTRCKSEENKGELFCIINSYKEHYLGLYNQ
jgi:hypothetical protein